MTQSLINRKKIYFTSMLKTIDDIKNVYSQKYYNMTHQSRKQIKQLYKITNDIVADQPDGLWYAKHFCRLLSTQDVLTYDKIQDEEYIKNIDNSLHGKFMYGIKIKTKKIYTDIDHPNPNLILRLRNNQDNRKFITKYKVSQDVVYNKKGEPSYIYDYNWKKVAKDFAGIEIDNEKSPIEWTRKCYGCIWNTDIIADLKLLAKRDKRKYSPWEVVAPK